MGECKNDISTLLALINPANTISVNRCLAHSIGLQETVVYQALIAKYIYWNQRNMLEPDGTFFSTADDLERSTSLSEKQQRRLLKILTEKKLVTVTLRGCPPKRFMSINLDVDIISHYIKDGQIKSARPSDLNVPDGQNQIRQNVGVNNSIYNLKYNNQKKEKRSLPFQLSEAEEAIKLLKSENEK